MSILLRNSFRKNLKKGNCKISNIVHWLSTIYKFVFYNVANLRFIISISHIHLFTLYFYHVFHVTFLLNHLLLPASSVLSGRYGTPLHTSKILWTLFVKSWHFSPSFHYHWFYLPVGMCTTHDNHHCMSTLVIILIGIILLHNLQVHFPHHCWPMCSTFYGTVILHTPQYTVQ